MPIIDKDFLPYGLGKERKHTSKVTILAVVLIAVLMVGAVAWLTVRSVNNKESPPSETPVRNPARIAYTTHNPISITGNGGFTNASGVVWGSGTASDPYIISDWDINASTAPGILIVLTDAHFTVRNCYAHDGLSSNAGILLFFCVNGTLQNNICSDDSTGIGLEASTNITLINNTCCSNNYTIFWSSGIALDASSNNTIINNTCSNDFFGIWLESSSNNSLSNNNCSSNDYSGIDLTSFSDNNEVSRNLLRSNTGGGVEISSGSAVSGNRIWNNTFIGNNGATDTYDELHAQAFDNGIHNWWNSTEGVGNFWSDWRGPDLSPMDGIVDYPYRIDGSAGSWDYYPIAEYYGTPIPEFGTMPLMVMVLLAVILLTIGARRRKAQ